MTKERMGLYEGMYIFNAALSEDARKKSFEKLTSGIIEQGGEIRHVMDQGRRKLAYEIGKKREGYYYVLYFTAPTPAIKELWKEYRLQEDLLRFLTMRIEEGEVPV